MSVSRSTPKGIKVDGHLPFLAPPKDLLNWYKQNQGDESLWGEYVVRYRSHLSSKKAEIFAFLDNLDRYGRSPHQDMTLLCWEPPGKHCHRNIIREFVLQKHRPQYDGGESPGILKVGQAVDWPWCPDYLEKYVEMPLRIKSFTSEGLVRLKQIDKDIHPSFIRAYPNA